MNSTENMAQSTETRRLKHPFILGSVTAILLGLFALYLLSENENAFVTPYASVLGLIFVFGYYPITWFVSPVAMAITAQIKYGNTKGLSSYFVGSAFFGFVFSIPIALTPLLGLVAGR